MKRRKAIQTMILACTAPAIAKAGVLMPIKSPDPHYLILLQDRIRGAQLLNSTKNIALEKRLRINVWRGVMASPLPKEIKCRYLPLEVFFEWDKYSDRIYIMNVDNLDCNPTNPYDGDRIYDAFVSKIES